MKRERLCRTASDTLWLPFGVPIGGKLRERLTRSACGAIFTKACASLLVLNGPPPIVVSTVRIAGIDFNSASIDRIASSMAATLAPSGAAMLISNCASSTPEGRKSCRTMPYSGTIEAITSSATTATTARRRNALSNTRE